VYDGAKTLFEKCDDVALRCLDGRETQLRDNVRAIVYRSDESNFQEALRLKRAQAMSAMAKSAALRAVLGEGLERDISAEKSVVVKKELEKVRS